MFGIQLSKHKNDIIRWIKDYISSRWHTGNKGYLHFNGKVLDFSEFLDNDKRAKRKRRLIIDLDSKEYPQISISMYKFKKYIRQRQKRGFLKPSLV